MLHRRRHGFLSSGPFFLGGRLPVALFQTAHHHGGDEFLLSVIVELNHDALFAAGHNGAQTEFEVLHLSALRIIIGCHKVVYALLLEFDCVR